MKRVTEAAATDQEFMGEVVRHTVGNPDGWVRFLHELKAMKYVDHTVWPNQQEGLRLFLAHPYIAINLMPEALLKAEQRRQEQITAHNAAWEANHPQAVPSSAAPPHGPKKDAMAALAETLAMQEAIRAGQAAQIAA